jgi:ubiquinone biosynthesis protein COQ9
MEIFILNYKNEVKKLISQSYTPAEVLSKEFEYTTDKLVENFQRIIPFQSVDEHVVYEALIELGFEPKESEPLVFSWYFKRI